MNAVRMTVARFTFIARFEHQAAPATTRKFEALLPFHGTLLHARWSGEACWIPLGDFSLGVGVENPRTRPAPGQILWYAGAESETEVLIPYGESRFAAKSGELTGNHFLTIVDGGEALADLGRLTLWDGAQEITFAPYA